MPVLAATDVHTDIRQVLEDNQIGLWAKNGDLDGFIEKVEQLLQNKDETTAMGARGYRFLQEHYLASTSCHTILRHFEKH
jgi:glycosyltransferase involved in cell wall biosynthesis